MDRIAISIINIKRFFKVPETRNQSPEQILAKMDSKYAIANEESNTKLMGNTNV